MWASLGGIISGCLLAGLFVADWASEPAEPVTGDEAAEAFMAAWERSERGTYYVESTFHRVMATGRELESTYEVVQRPPDTLRFQLGGVDGRIGGRPVACAEEPDESVSCTVTDTEPVPHDRLVAEHLEAWDSLLAGPQRLYRVEQHADGCFVLTLTRFELVPPYGNYARFCFDAATGAVLESEVRRNEGTDYVEAVRIRAQVSDADFALPS